MNRKNLQKLATFLAYDKAPDGVGLGFSVMFWGEVTTKDLLATYARHEALANRVIEEQQELIRLMNNTSA